ncbi:IscS subfamily cysteine desulfurase [Mangrovibacillus cuniculi]|uniref:Aminotransferase class V-fold PLP-dependent enzyme n=1 Tax=Mangrovibacillus cuniculi TaxID=2593652 RepID=A0A7S8CBQ0_9BACI|nr:IscS subfamily cysteine desulfurase [Mangrovibacillus cuniculi]QPC47034.1 aminotransferase class V-fold PLP-dependent enzyme [Mangrovibacillus cuniculi]
MIYLDTAATTKMDSKAVEAYVFTAQNFFGNASSLHNIGGDAHHVLEQSRQAVADFLQVDERCVIFTSGGTESNRLALEFLCSLLPSDKSIYINETEHPSIFKSIPNSYMDQVNVISLFNEDSLPTKKVCEETKQCGLLVVQHVNSEIGLIHNVKEIIRMSAEDEILVHCDSVQSFGKLSLANVLPYVSTISISAHKIGGPKGVGALILNPTLLSKLQLSPKEQELGLRLGTENVPGIVSFAQSILSFKEKQIPDLVLWQMRKEFLSILKNRIPSLIILEGHESEQLPTIIGCIIPGLEGQWVMLEANRKGVALSTGSACQAGMQTISPMIKNYTKSTEEALGYFRISFDSSTTLQELKQAALVLVEIYEDWHSKERIWHNEKVTR